jgi:hypothetical protein
MSKRTIRELSAHDLTGRTLASHGISALSAIDRLARILLTWIRNKNAALRCEPLRVSCVKGRLVCGQLSALPVNWRKL